MSPGRKRLLVTLTQAVSTCAGPSKVEPFQLVSGLPALSGCTAPPSDVLRRLVMARGNDTCMQPFCAFKKHIINRCYLLLSLSRELSFSILSVVFLRSIISMWCVLMTSISIEYLCLSMCSRSVCSCLSDGFSGCCLKISLP